MTPHHDDDVALAVTSSATDTGVRAILVRPREPFFRWLQENGQHSPAAIEKRRARLQVVLVPHRPGNTPVSARGSLLRDIVEQQLADVCPDRSRWPDVASLESLADWFACLDDVDVWEMRRE